MHARRACPRQALSEVCDLLVCMRLSGREQHETEMLKERHSAAQARAKLFDRVRRCFP